MDGGGGWTQGQVQLRHLDMDAKEAGDFQRLAAPILYADQRFRASPSAILRGLRRSATPRRGTPGLVKFAATGPFCVPR